MNDGPVWVWDPVLQVNVPVDEFLPLRGHWVYVHAHVVIRSVLPDTVTVEIAPRRD